MSRLPFKSIFSLVILLWNSHLCYSSGEKLLLILFDGFRWDYVNQDMAGFAQLNKLGVQAEYLTPAFPSMSFPNYYSLVTGLYAENHGMVMNYMYDLYRQQMFLMLPHPNSSQSFWWEEAEPIWITATKKGLKTSLYLWPGGDVQIHGIKANFSVPYSMTRGSSTFRQHFEDAMQKFRSDEADLVQIYCEYTDYVGHESGPDSEELQKAVKDIDSEIKFIIEKLQVLDFTNKVNVVIVSDHGMTATGLGKVKRVSLGTYIQNTNIVQYVFGQGAIVGVYPRPGYLEDVFQKLRKASEFDVWKKNDIPERFHIKNHARTPPILVLAKKGFFIDPITGDNVQIPYATAIKNQISSVKNGYHGYDVDEVEDMRGIFFAFGPGFESNLKAPAIRNVDVYNIMMHLLDLEPNPNNGSWTSVFKMIRGENDRNGASHLWYEGISNVLSCIGCIYMYSLIAFVHSVWI